MFLIRPVVRCGLVVLSAGALFGCAGGGGDASGDEARLRFGAIDPDFRRPGGDAARPKQNVFEPLALPAPNEMRLGSGQPGPGYWQNRADYVIDATVDPEGESLEASMTLTYHNDSPHELGYVWMQLEQNLFHPDSLGARSFTPGGVLRGRPDFEGGYDISNVRVDGDASGMEIFDTLGRIDLAEPLGPGESVEIALDFAFEVPPYLRRMGAETVGAGKILQFAQWFPHACKYDDVSGWNTLPYLGSGEFYTDFGDYRVSVTVPGDFIVTATGELENASDVLSPRARGRLDEALASEEPVWIVEPDEVGTGAVFAGEAESRTWVFEAEDVRTFAFSTSDAWMWDAAGATVTDLDGTERRVLCQSLYPAEGEVWLPTHEDGGSTRYVKHAVEFYSDFLYPYPYPHMTNVNGPEGGMEYPMIIYCGARTNPRGLFGVTDHEVGHTWFPMIVNTDERRHVWMDEGFNTFVNSYSERAWYGEDELNWERTTRRIVELAQDDNLQPVSTAPDRMWPRWIGRLGYGKTGMGMMLLREYIVGPERFDAAFRGYIDDWAFKSPQPADFFRSIEDGAGMELDWFYRTWFLGTGSIDIAIVDAGPAEDHESAYVTFVNKGDIPMPVPYRVTFDDGSSVDLELPFEAWGAADKYRAIIDAGGRAIRSVQIDPRGLMPDVDLRNNRWGG